MRVFVCFLITLIPSVVFAEDLLPPETAIEQVIDHYIDAELAKEGVTPAAQADDATLLRRTTLDLAGRIPTVTELDAYLQDSSADKRQNLVTRLLESPDFPLHQRNAFDMMLLGGNNDNAWREYLFKAFQENRPWDKMFREMFLSRDDDEQMKSALAFLKSRGKSVDDLTNDTSRLFFGVSINCAKCHDHPLVLDWTQDHYFGMTSFFATTYINKRNQVAERDEAEVKFKTTEGEEKQAKLMFLTGAVIDAPAAPELSPEERKALEKARKEEEEKKEGPPPPAPEFSRREELVELALRSEDNYFFSRSIVNRVWSQYFGRGMVMPLDQMHSENPPSHPELMDWLARDLVTNGYDLKRLMRGIVLSQAYSRDSRWEGDPPQDRLFALALTRPLAPREYSLSLHFATQNPDNFPADMKPEDWAKRRQDLDNRSGGFANQIEIPGDNYQVSVSEALLFSNGQQFQNEFLNAGGDRLLGKLKTLTTPADKIKLAFRSVLSREPAPEEVDAMTQYLAARADREEAALQQMVWALLTSSETRFNY